VKPLLQVQDFGAVDAESDDVEQFFITTDIFDAVLALKSTIIVGRKGSGKTAIYKGLLKRATGRPTGRGGDLFVSGLSFKNYPWPLHNSVANNIASKQEKYLASWQFLIAVELASKILTTRRENEFQGVYNETYKRIKRFVEKNWGVKPSHKDLFKPNTFDVSGTIAPTILGNSLGELNVTKVPRTNMGNILQDVAVALFRDLATLISRQDKYLILFDELDLGLDLADEDYNLRLIGLLLAAREVSLWAKQNGLQVAPVVFLRSDIYRTLSFSDKNKLHENHVRVIEWKEDKSGHSSLLDLMNQRIRIRFELPSSVEDPWSLVFDEIGKMRGTQHKCNYIIDRSFMRPRDIIKFCNLALTQAQVRLAEIGLETGSIISEDIHGAREEFSKYLEKELDDEVHQHLPKWKTLLSVLRRVHYQVFTKEIFQRAYLDLGAKETLQRTADQALADLYQFGIVGFQKIGGGGGGSNWHFQYEDESIDFDVAATTFKVHLGLKETLDLRER